MAKKGFSVGKEALFKKIMPTNQEQEEMETVEGSSLQENSSEPAAQPVSDYVPEEQSEDPMVGIPDSAAPVQGPMGEPVTPVQGEPERQQIQQQPAQPAQQQPGAASVAEHGSQGAEGEMVRPLVYGLPEDKQPGVHNPAANEGQMYPGYGQPPYPNMPEQMMPGQQVGYPPYMGGYPPPYPMQPNGYYGQPGIEQNGFYPAQMGGQLNPFYNPNAALAAMYYANANTGQQEQQAVLQQMVMDGAQMSLYDMLEDIPPIAPISSLGEELAAPAGEQVEGEPEIPVAEELAIVEEPVKTPEPRWKLVNVMEQVVEEKAVDLMRRDGNICMCEKCVLDVIAITLNKLPSRYTTDFTPSLIDFNYQTYKVQLMVAVFDAIDLVKASPRHDEAEEE